MPMFKYNQKKIILKFNLIVNYCHKITRKIECKTKIYEVDRNKIKTNTIFIIK